MIYNKSYVEELDPIYISKRNKKKSVWNGTFVLNNVETEENIGDLVLVTPKLLLTKIASSNKYWWDKEEDN